MIQIIHCHTTALNRRRSSTSFQTLLCVLLGWMLFSEQVHAATETTDEKVGRFFATYCTGCHGTKKAKGKVTLHDVSLTNPSAQKLELWERVIDALKSGTMPPEDEKTQPSGKEREEISTVFNNVLRQAMKGIADKVEKAKSRRLTNFEYENTMRDLLGVPLHLKATLPEDPVKPYHFNNTAEFMLMGPEQIERYLECAKRALASIIVDQAKPEVKRVRREWKAQSDRSVIGQDEVPIWGNQRNTAATGMNVDNPSRVGEFAIRFKASAILLQGATEIPLRLLMGQELSGNPTLRVEPIGTVRLRNSPDAPEVFELRGRLENFPVAPPAPTKGKPTPERFTITPQNLYDDGSLNDNNNFQKTRNVTMPRVVIEWMEFEGPLTSEWPPEQHRRILFDSPLRQTDEKAYVKQVLERFVSRAFRRPATADEISRFAAMHDVIRPNCASFEEAMRETLALVLISPQFLFHTVADGESISAEHELASRLSYFLWGSMPDEELLRIAATGTLAQPKMMEQQVLRMLTDPRSADFVKNFTIQWLSLAKMKTVPINKDLFPRFLYYVPIGERAGAEEPYRPTVRDFMLEETTRFVGELVSRNASVLNVVDSDFAMLNQRLAVHYGVPGVQGDELRAVPVKPEHHLGGLLTQGSVLIGNSNGTAPHPIYRAVWLREAILGEDVAPPPADVPALSDSAGPAAEKALSIKDLLVKHRQVEACNDCHARLDPWGVPFEHYNAIGQFQQLVPRAGTRVRGFNPKQDNSFADYLAYLQTVNTVKVEADAHLPNGPTVEGIPALKAYILQYRADDVAGNVLRRLATYGLARTLNVRDRFAMEELLERARAKGFGMRDMIVAICQSKIFTSTRHVNKANTTKPR